MLRQTLVVAGGVALTAVASRPCGAEGRWGVEVSGALKKIGVVRSYSLRNEFHLRACWDWDEYLNFDFEETGWSEHPDTTIHISESSIEGHRSWGDLTVEAGFVRFLRSGGGLSPSVGIVARFRPYGSRHDYDYRDGSLRMREETSLDAYELSIVVAGGLRHFFNEHLAAAVDSDLVSCTYRREDEAYGHYSPDSDVRSVYERTRTSTFLSFTMQPTVYLQYYF